MMRGIILMAVVSAALAAPAIAGERTGYPAIASGDLSQAERTLVAERRIFPQRPDLMLNLAAVYQQTGRAAAAASLYREILDRPSVPMDLPSGTTRFSHDIADSALRRFAPTTLAVR